MDGEGIIEVLPEELDWRFENAWIYSQTGVMISSRLTTEGFRRHCGRGTEMATVPMAAGVSTPLSSDRNIRLLQNCWKTGRNIRC